MPRIAAFRDILVCTGDAQPNWPCGFSSAVNLASVVVVTNQSLWLHLPESRAAACARELVSFLPMGAPDERLSTISVDAAARERVAQALSHHFAEDHIGTDELETRLARVYAATTAAELDAVVSDLPATAAEATAALAPHNLPAERISALFSGQEQRMTGEVPRRLEVNGRLGYVELDLTHATFASGLTEIDVRAFMGYVEIRLPAGVRVENRGHALFGFFSLKGRGGPDQSPAVLRISGRATFGYVELFVSRDPKVLPKPE